MIQNYFRMVASILSVASYLSMIQGHTTIGISINLLCQVLIVPFAIKAKAYDMCALSALFGGINIHALVSAAFS